MSAKYCEKLLAQANARTRELLVALKSVEWTGENHDRDNCWPACPSCVAPSAAVTYDGGGEGDPGQHMSGCVLAAAISKAVGSIADVLPPDKETE